MEWKMLLGFTLSMAVAGNASCTDKSCVNGYCNDNTDCRCFHGFTMDPNGICVPFERCTQDQCRYGICSPITFVCTCQGGYTKDPNGNCVPIVRCAVDSCPNGHCSSSGQCFCKPGYFKGPNGVCLATATCAPETCVNGDCDRNTQACVCKPGFEKNVKGGCTASNDCTLRCENGQCAKLQSQQEVCHCHAQYRNHPDNNTVCVLVAGQENETARSMLPSTSTPNRLPLNREGDGQSTSSLFPPTVHSSQQAAIQTHVPKLPPLLVPSGSIQQGSAPHTTTTEVFNKPTFPVAVNGPPTPLPTKLLPPPPLNVKKQPIPLSPNPLQSTLSQLSITTPLNINGPPISNPLQSMFPPLSFAPPVTGTPIFKLNHPFPASTSTVLGFLRALTGNVDINPTGSRFHNENPSHFGSLSLDPRSTSMLIRMLSMNQFVDAMA